MSLNALIGIIASSGGGIPGNTMRFRVRYAAPGTFTLPIDDGTGGASGYVFNFTVNWGDGSPLSTVVAYNDPNAVHTYAAPGTYDVTMTGTCQFFSFDVIGVDADKPIALLGFTGDIGLIHLDFSGCSNLTTIAPLGVKASLVDVGNLFGATGISSIPPHMFDGCPAITTFKFAFAGCLSLTALPVDLFRYNTLVTNFFETFGGCTGLTAIPVGIFDYNTLVTTVGMVFYACYSIIQAIPGDIFKNCLVLTAFGNAFWGCLGLTGHGWGPAGTPNTIIDWTTQPGHAAPVTTAGCFQGCTGLTNYAGIPAGWL